MVFCADGQGLSPYPCPYLPHVNFFFTIITTYLIDNLVYCARNTSECHVNSLNRPVTTCQFLTLESRIQLKKLGPIYLRPKRIRVIKTNRDNFTLHFKYTCIYRLIHQLGLGAVFLISTVHKSRRTAALKSTGALVKRSAIFNVIFDIYVRELLDQ